MKKKPRKSDTEELVDPLNIISGCHFKTQNVEDARWKQQDIGGERDPVVSGACSRFCLWCS